MAKTSMNIRMDSEIKQEAKKLFAEFGLDMTTAVNLFLRQSIREHRIPFEIRLEVSNQETISAIQEAEELLNDESEREFDYLKEIVTAIRNIRGEANVSPAKKIEVIFKVGDNLEKEILNNNSKILDKLANVEKYDFTPNVEIPKLIGFRLVETTGIYVPLADLIDKEKEIEKLEKDIEKAEKELDRVLGKLSNEAFVSKAPQEVIQKENAIKKLKLKKNFLWPPVPII